MAVYSLTSSPTIIEDGTHKGIDVTNTGTMNVTLSTGDVLKPGAALTICPTGVITARSTPLNYQLGGYSEATTAVDTQYDPVIIREDLHDNATYQAKNTVLLSQPISLADFGAVGDKREVTDAVATSGSAVVTSATAAFSSTDTASSTPNKYVTMSADQVLASGGTANGTTTYVFSGITLTQQDRFTCVQSASLPAGTYIQTVVNGTTVTLNNAATATASGEAVTLKDRLVFPAGTRVLSQQSSTQVTLTNNALFNVASGGDLVIGTDNLTACQAWAASYDPTKPAHLYVPPRDYWSSDQWLLDGDRLELEVAGSLATSLVTSTGGTLQILGNGNLGATATPYRDSVAVYGFGRVLSALGRRNENAIGFCRYRRMLVENISATAGRKGLTAQYCPTDASITVRSLEVPIAKLYGISLEDQGGAMHATLSDIKIGSADFSAIAHSSGDFQLRGARIGAAYAANPTAPSNGSVHIYSAGGSYVQSVEDVHIIEANTGKGVVFSTGLNASARRVAIDHSGQTGVEFYNCTGLNVVEDLLTPNSPTTYAATGTSTPIVLRGNTQLEISEKSSGESTISRFMVNSTALGLTSGTMRLSYFGAKKTESISQVRVPMGATGATATPTLCRVGIFSVDSSGNLTLVASTPNDTTLFATANIEYTKSLSAAFTKVAGQRYAVGLLVVSAQTMPTFCGYTSWGNITGELGAAPFMCGSIAGQSDLPSTLAAGSVGAQTAMPYVALLP